MQTIFKTEANTKFTVNINNKTIHAFLEWQISYSPEEIEDCKGKYNCYNCQIPVNRIYFYPTLYNKHEQFGCCAWPHCSPSCTLRTVLDLPNHENLITYHFLMYGIVQPSPPRFMLYVPGGVSLPQYHELTANNVVIQQDSKHVRSFLCPSYVSSSYMPNFQMSEAAIQATDAMANEHEGPKRARDMNKVRILELPRPDPAANLFKVI